MKKKLLIGLISSIIIVGGTFSIQFLTYSKDNSEKSIINAHSTSIADFSDKRILVGSSNNVFIGKVLQQSGTKNLSVIPETQFSVQVLENIKGSLPEMVTVNQQGGLHEKEGTKSLVLLEGDNLLIPGQTYLFATRYLASENWYTIVPNFGDILIEGDTAFDFGKEGKLRKNKDALITEFRNALTNEIIPDAIK